MEDTRKTKIYVSCEHAAKYFGYSKRHFRRILEERQIPYMELWGVGGSIHIFLWRDMEGIPTSHKKMGHS